MTLLHLREHLKFLCLMAISFFSICGCDREEEIRVYEVAKKSPAASEPARILAAIIPNGDSVYFIKAFEQPQRLDALSGELSQIVQDLRFDDRGGPIWKLPSGWSQTAGSGMAIANLECRHSDPPIRFAVTVLGAPIDNWERYLEENINRWRGQVMLEPQSMALLRSSIQEVAAGEDGRNALIVDLQGKRMVASSTASRATPLESMTSDNREGVPVSKSDSSPSMTANTPSPIQYQAPAHWRFAGSNPFRLASFEIADAGESGEVTVSVAKDDLEQNSAMWQQQVGQRLSEEENRIAARKAVEQMETVELNHHTVRIVQFGSDDSSDAQAPAMLIAMVPTEGAPETIFVKLRGSGALIDKEKENFLQFVDSIRW